jgi:hypothetical protein
MAYKYKDLCNNLRIQAMELILYIFSNHYRKTGHFRRPPLISSAKETADENIQFISSAKTGRRNYDLFSSAQKGRRKHHPIFVGSELADEKLDLFSSANIGPTKLQHYFRRLT